MPTVTFDVDRYDSRGRELEWSWNLDGGLWRPYHDRRARSSSATARSRGRASTGRPEVARQGRLPHDDGRDVPGRHRLGRPEVFDRQGRSGMATTSRCRCGTSSAATNHVRVRHARRRRRRHRRGCRARIARSSQRPLQAARRQQRRARGVREGRARQHDDRARSRRSTASRAAWVALRSDRRRAGAGGLVLFGIVGSASSRAAGRRAVLVRSRAREEHRRALVGSAARSRSLAGLQLRQERRAVVRDRVRLRPDCARRASCRTASTTRACAPTTSRPAASVRTAMSRPAPTARSGSRAYA